MSFIPTSPLQSTQALSELLRSGDELYARGEFQNALLRFLAVLKQRPNVAEHHYRVGLALWRLGQHDPARRQFEQAILLKPDDSHSHAELGRVLLAMGQVERALLHARRAAELSPQDPAVAIALAAVLEADRKSEPAEQIVDQLLLGAHESTDLALIFARLAPRRGAEAAALALIGRLLQTPLLRTPRERSALHFAAANLLDGLGRYDEAFEHAAAANTLRGARYDAVQAEQPIQGWIDSLTRARLSRMPRATHASQLPVFIVGMPRSGTSLVEQILASHPAIHGGGELDWISRLCDAAMQRCATGPDSGLECLSRLTARDLDELASQYLLPLQSLSATAIRITDKMPINFVFLGLIALLFPNARVIHCRRDAMDTCLSCYMTDFTAGYDFSFSLSSLGHFYRQYDRLMAHWKSAIDLAMLDVDYEKVVGDTEGEARRMIAFLGLAWDDRCLRFHENRRFVGTASNSQVRQPIYGKSVGRWRHYERHLEALRAALKPAESS